MHLFFCFDKKKKAIQNVENQLLYYLYWLSLGILSSIGLGTGMHTFVLFLGPFIMKVTRTAYTCGSLQFPVTGNSQ